jgi:hypothetical protein
MYILHFPEHWFLFQDKIVPKLCSKNKSVLDSRRSSMNHSSLTKLHYLLHVLISDEDGWRKHKNVQNNLRCILKSYSEE